MSAFLLSEAHAHLTNTLRGKQNPRETLYPWRKSWEFTVLHCQRVDALVLQILEGEAYPLPEDEILTLRLAALLHDLARLEETDDHAGLGAARVDAWLQTRPDLAAQVPDIPKLLGLIADHSNKHAPEPDFCRAVLKDADLLDEIGIMSVFMAANRVDQTSPFFLHDLLHRLTDYEIPYCDKQLHRLNTATARAILLSKRAFIEGVIGQLQTELDGSLE